MHYKTTHRADTMAAHQIAIERVIAHMRAYLAEPLDLNALSSVAAMSRFHFIRVFEEITGVSPHHFLSCLRIQHAKALLADSDRPVTDICMTVGYSSLGSFSSVFAQFVGLSPTAFRNLPRRLSTEQVFQKVRTFLQNQQNTSGPFLKGRLESCDDSRGYYFVGAFTTGVPQGRPQAGTVMLSPGTFRIAAPRQAKFHLLAALLPFSALSANQQSNLPVRFIASCPIDASILPNGILPSVLLRLPRPTDPPILVCLGELLSSA